MIIKVTDEPDRLGDEDEEKEFGIRYFPFKDKELLVIFREEGDDRIIISSRWLAKGEYYEGNV